MCCLSCTRWGLKRAKRFAGFQDKKAKNFNVKTGPRGGDADRVLLKLDFLGSYN